MKLSTGRTLNIVAHQDDDLLFLSSDLLHAVQSGRVVRTVFLTAGDAGINADYWQARERGVKAAYALMCGIVDDWTQTDAGINDYPIPIFTLVGYPTVSLAFMRLPDGNIDGSGFPSTHHQSLQRLWTESIPVTTTVNGSSSYSKSTLIHTLARLISSFQPDQINTQDYTSVYGNGDHSDHYSTAYFVRAAAQCYTSPHRLTAYEGYTTSTRPANLAGADLTAKQNTFYAYAHYDKLIGGVPRILPDPWRRNIRLRQIVFSLRTLRPGLHRRLKAMRNAFASNTTASSVELSFSLWLQRQYVADSLTYTGSEEISASY